MEGGYVRLWRKIEGHAVWQDPNLLKLFLHLIMRAAHRPKPVLLPVGRGVRVVQLSRGQVIVGRHALSKKMGWPGGTTRDRLHRLQTLGCVEIQSDNQFSIVNVVNYEKFQPVKHPTRQPTRQPNEREDRQPNELNLEPEIPDESEFALSEPDNQTNKNPPSNRQPTDTKKNDQELEEEGRNHPRKQSVRPSLDEIRSHCKANDSTIDPEAFFHHYEANGWKQASGRPIINWKSAVVTWQKRQASFNGQESKQVNGRKVKVLA